MKAKEVVVATSTLPGTLLVNALDVIYDVATMQLWLNNLEIEVLILIEGRNVLFLKGNLVEVRGGSLEFFLLFSSRLVVLAFHLIYY